MIFKITIVLLLLDNRTSKSHMIFPVDVCLVADMCNHTWIPQCAFISTDTMKSFREFRDLCDMYEFNCDNNMDFIQKNKQDCNKLRKFKKIKEALRNDIIVQNNRKMQSRRSNTNNEVIDDLDIEYYKNLSDQFGTIKTFHIEVLEMSILPNPTYPSETTIPFTPTDKSSDKTIQNDVTETKPFATTPNEMSNDETITTIASTLPVTDFSTIITGANTIVSQFESNVTVPSLETETTLDPSTTVSTIAIVTNPNNASESDYTDLTDIVTLENSTNNETISTTNTIEIETLTEFVTTSETSQFTDTVSVTSEKYTLTTNTIEVDTVTDAYITTPENSTSHTQNITENTDNQIVTIESSTKENEETESGTTCELETYPKDCNRPHTWMTTAIGEIRDVYQLIRLFNEENE